MTIAAVWLGLTMKRLRDQERAVSRILELGGKVAYDFQRDAEWNTIPNPIPPGPQWLRLIFGPQWRVRVIAANFHIEGHGRATDQDLAILSDLPDLRHLELGGSKSITDEGLSHVGRLENLEGLVLKDCTSITDEGLVHLSSLYSLTNLSLVRCRMDGSGLRHVKHLPLRYLCLNYVPITDDNLASVAAMGEMEMLELQETAITGHGLNHTKGLTNLRRLDVNRTAVDDAGLVHLTGLAKLEHLLLSRTQVTNQGVDGLKQALPNLHSIDH
jgi:hypothetical protein